MGSIIYTLVTYNEDINVIQVVTLEKFIKEHMQETA
jgi:hypothetical protein